MGAALGLLVEEGFDALGLDRSDDLLAEAERRGQVVKADYQMPFEDGSLTGAICECVLSQQKELSPALSRACKGIKEGGILG